MFVKLFVVKICNMRKYIRKLMFYYWQTFFKISVPPVSKQYNLDSLHYYNASGLAFERMLKISQVQLELMGDIDMILFIERCI